MSEGYRTRDAWFAAAMQYLLEGCMNSVRQRIERPLREAPEKIVDTGNRRTALGASGPTLSTRQAQTLKEDATEVLAPSPHTRTGGTDFMSGNLSRVRDRQIVNAASKPEIRAKTQQEIDADAWLEYEMNWKQRLEQGNQDRINAQRRREAEMRAAEAARKAVAELKQTLIDECGLSPSDAERVARERVGGRK